MGEYQWIKFWFWYIKVFVIDVLLCFFFICLCVFCFVFVLIFIQDLDWEPNSIDVWLICIQSQLLLIIKETKIIIHTVTFRGIVNVGKIYCDFFFYRRNTYLRYYIEHRHYINIKIRLMSDWYVFNPNSF
jgi:hypothetical protein